MTPDPNRHTAAGRPSGAGGQPAAVRAASRRQRARRRDGGPGTHRRAAARPAGVRHRRLQRNAVLHRRVRLTKAAANDFAGTLADRFGRKPVLVAGWLAALPVPLLLIWAPSWGWVIAANVLLGVNQGLAWIMKIDLVGPLRRGTAMGFNEAAGYGAVAVAAWAPRWLDRRLAPRPVPAGPGVRRGRPGPVGRSSCGRPPATSPTRSPTTAPAADGHDGELTARQVFALATWRDRSLSAASQAGLVNNLNEGMAWGLVPRLLRGGPPRPVQGRAADRHRRPSGAPDSSQPGRCPGSVASGSSPPASSPKLPVCCPSPPATRSPPGPPAVSCSVPVPRWPTRA